MRTTDVLQRLFSDPLRAVTEAEADYREIWADWLERKLDLLNLSDSDDIPDGLLETTPVINLDGRVDLSVTLRVASTTTREGGVGLELASFPMTGSFSFSEQRTEESVFKASASFTVTNAQTDLTSYLAQHGVQPETVGDLRAAAEQLRNGASPSTDDS